MSVSLQTVTTRDQDRPRYGTFRQQCLDALVEPGTVADLADRLDWRYDKARNWLHYLLHVGAIRRVDTVRTPAGQLAGRYVVTP